MKLYKTNDTIERKFNSVTFTLAYFLNDEFQQKRIDLMAGRDDEDLTIKEHNMFVAKAMGGTVVLGWEGWKEHEYSEENAEQLLVEDEVLREKIMPVVRSRDNFRIDNDEKKEKK